MKLGVFALFLISTFAFSETKLPERIASLSLASDEILLELLTRCGRSKALLAISTLADDTRYSNVSSEAKSVKLRVGSSLEHLLKLNPDLIFAATFNRKELLDGLRKAKLNVIVLKDFESFQDVSANMLEIAKATGCEKAGKEMNTDFERNLNQIPKIKKPLRLIQYSKSGRIMAGKTTFDAVVNAVGASNIASSEFKLSYWPMINIEKIISANPDVIVTFSKEDFDSVKVAVGWKELAAVKSGKIIQLNPAAMQAVSQHLVKSADELSKKLSKFD